MNPAEQMEIPKSLSVMESKTFAELKKAVEEKEVLVHPAHQTRIEVSAVVSAIEDVEAAIELGATRDELRYKIQHVTKTEGIREKVIEFVLSVRPDIK